MAKINSDLQKDRNSATFETNSMTYLLDGNEEITKRRREMEELAVKEFSGNPEYHFLSRTEKYSDSVRKSVQYIKCCKKYDLNNAADAYWFRSLAFPNETPPIGLHDAMFLPSLRGQCTDEQKKRWLGPAEHHEILGTYAQTELGHGTFVRGLETTATYDRKTEEFILHSPTLTSTKWWPGGLGKTSNYAIVMALLFIDGKSYGMNPFMVQLRSLETHQPLPGISVGDIGPKFGYDTIDNGFLRFDNVRIPRGDMLMKNSQVLKDGTYVKSAKSDKLSYGTMVFVRAMIIYDVAARGLAQAATIAMRYSAVRRQSEIQPGQPEPQILDYQTQQYKLFPLLATAYALWFTGTRMREMYFQINYEIQQGNVDMLPELHGLSCGVKAYATNMAMWGIERCRLACGGHGYSHASGIPKIYVSVTPACTYEGENTVMLLQAARYLMKAYQSAKQGEALTGSVDYLTQSSSNHSQLNQQLGLDALLEAFQHKAKRLITEAAERLTRLQNSGKDQHDAWNANSVLLTQAATAHCEGYVLKTFIESLERSDDPAMTRVLTQLCQLYAVYTIAEDPAGFIEDGFLSSSQLDLVRDARLSLLSDIRPNAIALVDAFDFRDELLCSILGRYDGNVYENLYKWAQTSPLNSQEVTEAYKKYLQPLVQGSVHSKL